MLRTVSEACALPLTFAILAASLTLQAPAQSATGWQPLTHRAPFNASTMFLLMDGRVLVNELGSAHCWLLAPDLNGSYVNGTWTQAADMLDDRLYYASGVLADGRVIMGGGEYSNSAGSGRVEIYDPVADHWTGIPTPVGLGYIGDAPSVVLADGRFMFGAVYTTQVAIYDPVANAWMFAAGALDPTGSGEQTWTLLPDGTVLTAHCFHAPASSLYDPVANRWVALGNTPVNLVNGQAEIGPGMMLYTGEAFVIGATPTSARYLPATTPGNVGTWVNGGSPPTVAGVSVEADDAPASILPNGHVLCALGFAQVGPTYFFEYDGSQFVRVTDPANNVAAPFEGRMLPLPTGEVLFAASTPAIYVYTAAGGPNPAWLPTITAMATDVIPGETYILSGTQLNGLTTANSYGDECGVATNYPLVRLHFLGTGHVIYCRCHDPSTMGIATGARIVSTHVQVPANCELGAAELEVVANGLASAPMRVFVHGPITIGFDALAAGVVVDSQHPEVTFSAPTGFANWTVAANSGTSQPNVIRTGASSGSIDGMHDTIVEFRSPVASLTFAGVGLDQSGPVASVRVFENGVPAAPVAVEGLGTPNIPVRVDLTAFHDVTRIEITGITDAGGIGWDDFKFCLSSSASWRNYGVGFPGTLGVPSLTATRPILGSTLTVNVTNSLGSATSGLLLVGLNPISIATPVGGTLLVNPILTAVLPISATGTSIGLGLPTDPAFCDLRLCSQVLELDAGAANGISFTRGLDLVLGF